jgi:hypothetical protein
MDNDCLNCRVSIYRQSETRQQNATQSQRLTTITGSLVPQIKNQPSQAKQSKAKQSKAKQKTNYVFSPFRPLPSPPHKQGANNNQNITKDSVLAYPSPYFTYTNSHFIAFHSTLWRC